MQDANRTHEAGEAEESIALFRASANDFLGAADQRQRVRRLEAGDGGFEHAVWAQIAELGWLSILVPETAGGLGLGIAEACAIAEEAGRHLLPEPLLDAGLLPPALLAALPAGGLRDELLARLQSGGSVAGVAWQEGAGGLDAGAGTTTAAFAWSGAGTGTRSGAGTDSGSDSDSGSYHGSDTRAGSDVGGDADALRLDGRKRFVRPGKGADGWIVPAKFDDGGFALAWVAAGAAGLRIDEERGVDGGVVATLAFESAEARLLARGDEALAALRRAVDLARIAQAAELAGIARRALEITRDYLCTRVQFGKPIGSFQALQHRLVDGLIQVELASAALRDGLAAIAATPDDDDGLLLAATASRVKARCAHAALEMTRLAIQLHGAIGTTNEYDIGLYFKRALMLAGRWGNAAAHRRQHFELTRPAADHAADGAATESSVNAAAAPSDCSADADWDAMPEAEFRSRVRALFAAHYPEQRRHLPYRQTWAESKDWYLTLARLGWLAPAWPKKYGGMELPPDKLIAWIEETEAWGVARSPDQGLVMVGPILMRFGTDEQRARFLPPILRGEHVWTQGYSEPGAGSDLAAVRTEAVIDGDHFIVNGQKTWTTWGADGSHMFMLVRTDRSVKKQAGISFLLVDLKTPGITVRPIANIAGENEFCEVFFDDVRVPRANLVGELNQGWTIAKALLGFERLFTGSPKHTQHTLHQLEKLARQRGLFDDAAFAARFAELQLDTADLRAAYTGFAEIAKRGEPIPASISMLKIWSTETWERLALLLVESAGEYGTLRDRAQGDGIDLHVVAPLFNMLGAKIFAGSNEIQRNILAKAVLDLPS